MLDGLDSRMEMTEGRVSKLEDRFMKVSQPNKERENKWEAKLKETQGSLTQYQTV